MIASEALQAEADKAYDAEDQSWFDSQSTEDLAALWALCCNIETMPSYDDEVYDALAKRGYFDK